MKDNGYALLGAFVAGVLIGGGAALLMAPQRGKDSRKKLRACASLAKDDLVERGKEALSATAEQGKEYLKSGREAMKDFIGNTRDHIEKRLETLQEVGRQADDTLRTREKQERSQKAS
jgi:gas vesicle protein